MGDANRSGLSRRRMLYGLAATGAAAASGSGVAAVLADTERVDGRFAAGTLDLDVEVRSPARWKDSEYTTSLGVHDSQTATFDLTVDGNPAYVWLLTPCPTCRTVEEKLQVSIELTAGEGADPDSVFSGTLRSLQETSDSGWLLSTSALADGETWTVSFTWTLLEALPGVADLDFGFEFRAVQERNLDDPTSYDLDVDTGDCGGCGDREDPECGKEISYVAFCGGESDETIAADDIEFAHEVCGDTGDFATLSITKLPSTVGRVLLKYGTNLDVFAYDGEDTPIRLTTGWEESDLRLVDTYTQDKDAYPESGDPPRTNSDPCAGGEGLKFEFDDGSEKSGDRSGKDRKGGDDR
jgi:hypothetical protein